MRDVLVLLTTRAARDHAQAEAFAAAARQLSLHPQIRVGDSDAAADSADVPGLLFALACSETHALTAARLNARHNAGGLPPSLVAQLGDPASALPLLGRLTGLPWRQEEPADEGDEQAGLLLAPGRAALFPPPAARSWRRLRRLGRAGWGRGLLQLRGRRCGFGARLHLTGLSLRAAGDAIRGLQADAHYRLLAALLFEQKLELAA